MLFHPGLTMESPLAADANRLLYEEGAWLERLLDEADEVQDMGMMSAHQRGYKDRAKASLPSKR
jgi:hypothetical protein